MAIPDNCRLGKRVFKKLFHENAKLGATDKKAFREDIDVITWAYTLKPSTIPIRAYEDDRREYHEVAILQADLKTLNRTSRIAEIIHRAIPYPLLIVLSYKTAGALSLAHKRFSFYDELWELINLRNDTQHFQSGLFVLDVPTFSERVVREAILNAVSHRDYQLGGNVFIRQYPRRLTVESPGGFPVGINEQNILDRQSPRNRRIADVLTKCGLVERSGQGMNLMFELSIQESKPTPDFTGTDQHQVVLNLNGEVQDPSFLQFLEKVGRETLDLFSTADFLLLDYVHKNRTIPDSLRGRLQVLVEKGIIERYGRGRGVKYVLSRRFYKMVDKKGAYTRKKGLDRETNKALLLKHIEENREDGSRLKDLMQVLPALSKDQVQTLIRELKSDGKIYKSGVTRAALWYPANTDDITSENNS